MSEHPEHPAFPVGKLLRWYRKHRSDLPWRSRKKSKDHPGRAVSAYATLVSEQMCQQTQVATVIPYFHRFLDAFPTVDALADADEQKVLKLWQGLGYYRRARNLHAAAKLVVAEFGGELPREVDDLLQLPGVGRYTAGAVASIAFDRPAPVLDGNVMRVLSRHDGIADPVDQTAPQKRLWARAGDLVGRSPKGARGDFNQALMELGATVCTPQPGSAKCMYCPLRETCDAFATGRVDVLPVKTPKKKPQAVTHHVLAIFRGGKLLFEQRPSTGLWANMWQLPTVEGMDSAPHAHAGISEHIRERFGLIVTPPQEVSRFPHATTHRAIAFVVHTAEIESGRLKPKSGVWRRADQVDDLPLPKPQLKALQLLK
ncbi:MAG: A/G-specific adenine glycosylase [Planctomycetota bacterium]